LEIKVLGNWSTGDAYSEIYNRGPPRKAMLASAMFNADERCDVSLTEETTNTKHTHKWSEAQ